MPLDDLHYLSLLDASERIRRRELSPSAVLEATLALEPDARTLLEQASERLGLSARGHVRTQRVARTIADLAGARGVARAHVAEALAYRRRRTRRA